jgi:hypothetical protein
MLGILGRAMQVVYLNATTMHVGHKPGRLRQRGKDFELNKLFRISACMKHRIDHYQLFFYFEDNHKRKVIYFSKPEFF